MSVVFSRVFNLWLKNFASVCVFTFPCMALANVPLDLNTNIFFSKAQLRSESSVLQIQGLGHRQLKPWAACSIAISSSAVTFFPLHQN